MSNPKRHGVASEPGRLLYGEEMLRLHGLTFDGRARTQVLQGFLDRDLHDLAGNAFNAGSFAKALLVLMAVCKF